MHNARLRVPLLYSEHLRVSLKCKVPAVGPIAGFASAAGIQPDVQPHWNASVMERLRSNHMYGAENSQTAETQYIRYLLRSPRKIRGNSHSSRA
jgi:hypothetical protein